MIDYERICATATWRKRRLKPCIDWRDLAQEAALYGLMGRKSVDGPMQDLLRREPFIGRGRVKVNLSRELLCDANLPPIEAQEHIIMPRIERALEALPFRWRKAIYNKFWLGYSQTEIAKDFGISHGRVTQIQNAAIERIREVL